MQTNIMPAQVSNAIQWIAVCGSCSRPTHPPKRGWRYHIWSGDSDYEFGLYVTTVNNPTTVKYNPFGDYSPPAAKSSPTAHALWKVYRLRHGEKRIPRDREKRIKEWMASWPGFLIITKDGRAIALAAYDFWNDKPKQQATYLGDFICRLVSNPNVAEIHDLPPQVPKGTVRAYSEEDVFLLLEHPELKLIEVGSITQAVQQVNALRAQIAELQKEKQQLEQQLAEISRQYARAGFESQEAAQARQDAERKLQETVQRELELQRQVQQLESQLAAAQAQTKKPWLWLAIGGGILALFFLLRR